MIDLYLRAETEADLAAALPFLRTPDGEWVTASHDHALDLIGPVVTTPGTYDADRNQLTPPLFDQRFHANLRCTEALAAQVPSSVILDPPPRSPSRVFA